MNSKNALERLKEGNEIYLKAEINGGDISPAIRKKTYCEGQHPYAVVITCSDSRVIPESIFSAGIGELFVIRAAGNTIDNVQLGSIEYAVEHLGCQLVLVLGHSKCGAVDAAVNHAPGGFVKFITDEIRKAVGDEKDDIKACCLNVRNSVKRIKEHLKIDGLSVLGGIYHIDSGKVEFLEN
ncbi:MAG: carbonic anhydrase [Clostridiales bacterium]|nr:carbonic anhydrase [Clostridiales bacterium]